jgi:small subunit ribosomal protein S1
MSDDTPEPESEFSKLLSDSLEAQKKAFAPGDRVRAEILAVGADDAIVAIGPAREGTVAAVELAGRKAGESVDLFVTSVRGSQVRLSIHPTDRNIAEDIQEAFETRRPVEGRVTEVCKGGVRVTVRGKSAFCPIGQLDLKRVETGAEFVGKTFVFRIVEFSEGGRNVVLSRRQLLEEDQARALKAFLSENPAGSIVQGKVSRLEAFGAFIELVPGVEGLAHISELAWSRVESPSDLLSVGQTVVVKLLKHEIVEGRLKIALSLKQAAEKTSASGPVAADPWKKYAAGQAVDGKVTRKEPYGLFVQLEPGVVGLLHQSKVAEHAGYQLDRHKVGDAIRVEIAEVKIAERRISLQLPRDPDADEWKNHQAAEPAPDSALAQQLRAALEKKRK